MKASHLIMFKRIHILALITLCSALGANAATLLVSGGLLVGASNVQVGNQLYTVTFKDDSYINLFGPNGAGLAATTAFDANQFSQALINQVFIPETSYNSIYDTDPEKTVGCGSFSLCYIWTPWAGSVPNDLNVSASIVLNVFGNQPDQIGLSPSLPLSVFADTSPLVDDVYAVWEVQEATVPVPAAAWLFGTGLLGLTGVARKRRLL
jgi:hypothetical protein